MQKRDFPLASPSRICSNEKAMDALGVSPCPAGAAVRKAQAGAGGVVEKWVVRMGYCTWNSSTFPQIMEADQDPLAEEGSSSNLRSTAMIISV